MKYTNITLCLKCGLMTERKSHINPKDNTMCKSDLMLYESSHIDFIDSITPLIKEIYKYV